MTSRPSAAIQIVRPPTDPPSENTTTTPSKSGQLNVNATSFANPGGSPDKRKGWHFSYCQVDDD